MSNEASAHAEVIADLASATASTPLPPNTAVTIVYILRRGDGEKGNHDEPDGRERIAYVARVEGRTAYAAANPYELAICTDAKSLE